MLLNTWLSVASVYLMINYIIFNPLQPRPNIFTLTLFRHTKNDKVAIPSHYFITINKCNLNSLPHECISSLNLLSLILPHIPRPHSCWVFKFLNFLNLNFYISYLYIFFSFLKMFKIYIIFFYNFVNFSNKMIKIQILKHAK